MRFSEVIGQQDVIRRLLEQFAAGRQPHALMLVGPEGCGKLAVAMALGNYLLCQNRGADSCGECPACKQIKRMGHPDLHFSFPIIRKSETTTCDDYMKEWKEMVSEGAYFGLSDWLDKLGTDNKQVLMPDAEGDNILRKLSITAFEGGYKVMIIWKPERMNASAANNLLKYLEEPSPLTCFILVTESADKVLPTIVSRTQQIEMSRLPAEVIAKALTERNGVDPKVATLIARTSNGSYLKALRQINIDDDSKESFERFVELMRAAYSRDVRKLQKWADDVASLGRERQKSFMVYLQNMLRENFIYNFHRPELNFMNENEAGFASKFARFINERNVVDFMKEMGQAQRDIEQNVNAKTVFFDFALRVTVLIRR